MIFSLEETSRLEHQLRHESDVVRELAAKKLGNDSGAMSSTVQDHLLERLRDDPIRTVSIEAAESLFKRGYSSKDVLFSKIRESLRYHGHDSNPLEKAGAHLVRRRAAEALGSFSNAGYPDDIIQLLKDMISDDEDLAVRAAAKYALEELEYSKEEDTRFSGSSLDDPLPINLSVAPIVGLAGSKDRLVNQLRDSSDVVRELAAKRLGDDSGRMQDAVRDRLLERLRDDPIRTVSIAAAESLFKKGYGSKNDLFSKIRESLRYHGSDSNPLEKVGAHLVRRRAAEVLSSFSNGGYPDDIIQLLKDVASDDEDLEVRVAAKYALEELEHAQRESARVPRPLDTTTPSASEVSMHHTPYWCEAREVSILRNYVNSVAVLMPKRYLHLRGDEYELNDDGWNMKLRHHITRAREEGRVDEGVVENLRPYHEQCAAGIGTVFLATLNHIVTAGHCVDESSGLGYHENYVVFGFYLLATGEQRRFPKKDVYSMKKIIARQYDERGDEALRTAGTNERGDWAILELDRPVSGGRKPLPLGEGNPSRDERVYVIGHPQGLPMKIDNHSSAKVVSSLGTVSHRPHTFSASLNIMQGYSGSAVFNARTNKVEGIVVRGYPSFMEATPAIRSSGEYCNTIREIKGEIEKLKSSSCLAARHCGLFAGAAAGAVAGAVLGSAAAGPPGAVVGLAMGGAVGAALAAAGGAGCPLTTNHVVSHL